MKKDYIKKYGKEEVIKNAKSAQALQGGGPAPEQQATQGGGQVNPEEIAMAYMQAKQAGDQNGMMQTAVAFMEALVVPSLEQQAQAGAPAMRKGGESPSLSFSENGELI